MRLSTFNPVFAASLALAGCANGIAQRQAELTPLIGKPETDVIQRLGVPTRTYEADGDKFLAYNQNSVDYSPGFYGPYGGGFYGGGFYGGFGGGFGGFYGGGFPPEVYVRTCETTIQLNGGTVKSFALHGNSCNYGTL